MPLRPQPKETQELSGQMHGRGSTISRNCFVTDFPGTGSCPGGCWQLPWRQPVGLGQRCLSILSASHPTLNPELSRKHRRRACWAHVPCTRGPEPTVTQAASGREEGPGLAWVRPYSWHQRHSRVPQTKTLWAVYCALGTLRGQHRDPHIVEEETCSDSTLKCPAHNSGNYGAGTLARASSHILTHMLRSVLCTISVSPCPKHRKVQTHVAILPSHFS